ncbi:tetrahydromethanopterin S-methyltransferase, subunit H [Thermanaeromonas toyohensis ToBE]|uniref:Tetrahydromethanopterin S-methyltransferase, subunit H n=1 Tax=Thermanaeromonas toyohensis ToBE TaxID=698762 RepID=A0A1W1VNM5_9FIRM|nr:hypothetical protein [Thermanaeromonas toyohensis]SMB94957.1 tetrahydromethanopterin S-methyltransferase, subunit H [Thermanaeromonas toyohensis ToBE]
MLSFTVQQKVFTWGETCVGGQPGERPPVLIGSIFFSGHRIVSDPVKGIFDRVRAKELLDAEAELAETYGLKRMIDVIGDTEEALTKYIEFVATHTEDPILVDSSSTDVRLRVCRRFKNTEVWPRLIYNSIDEHHTEAEWEELTSLRLEAAVILAFSPRALRPAARLRLLCGEDGQSGLLGRARAAGIDKLLVDVGCLDVPGTSWSAIMIKEIKEKLGYPVGCAPSNAFHTWQKSRLQEEKAMAAAGAAVYTLPLVYGADFIFYGPVRHAPWVYPACATASAIIAYGARLNGLRPVKAHPLYKIF